MANGAYARTSLYCYIFFCSLLVGIGMPIYRCHRYNETSRPRIILNVYNIIVHIWLFWFCHLIGMIRDCFALLCFVARIHTRKRRRRKEMRSREEHQFGWNVLATARKVHYIMCLCLYVCMCLRNIDGINLILQFATVKWIWN